MSDICLWFTPHQDDETLTFGCAIRNHANLGKRNVVVLLTDGSSSGVRAQLGMSRWRFAEARDDEMRRAVRHLGVLPGDLIIPDIRARDGELTVDKAKEIILLMLDRFPGAHVKAMSPLAVASRSADHVNSGLAAQELYDADPTVMGSLRHYIEPYLKTQYQQAHPGVTLSPESGSSISPGVIRAADEYDVDDDVARMHRIGNRSVATYFAQLVAAPQSWRHSPVA